MVGHRQREDQAAIEPHSRMLGSEDAPSNEEPDERNNQPISIFMDFHHMAKYQTSFSPCEFNQCVTITQ
jgi:hypothetical protein